MLKAVGNQQAWVNCSIELVEMASRSWTPANPALQTGLASLFPLALCVPTHWLPTQTASHVAPCPNKRFQAVALSRFPAKTIPPLKLQALQKIVRCHTPQRNQYGDRR